MANTKKSILRKWWDGVSTCCTVANQDREDWIDRPLPNVIRLRGSPILISQNLALSILARLVSGVRSHHHQIAYLSKLRALVSNVSPPSGLSSLNHLSSVLFLGIVARTHFVFAVIQTIYSESMQLCAFNAASLQWQELGIVSCPYEHFSWRCASSAIMDDKNGCYLYVIGGYNSPSKRVDRFNMKKKVWERLPDMHRERCEADVVVLEGHVYILGGYVCVGIENYVQHSGEMWEERSRDWREMRDLWPAHLFNGKKHLIDTKRHDRYNKHEAVVVMDALYAISRISREIMRFDTKSRLWLSVGSLPKTSHKTCFYLVPIIEELWVVSRCGKLCFVAATTLYPLAWEHVPYRC